MRKLNIPESSNIKEVFYDDKEKLLEVTFTNNTTYIYKDVPAPLIESFEHCSSAGKFFATNIRKGNFEVTKKVKDV